MPLTFPGRFCVLADSQGCCLCPLRMWDPLALGQSKAKLLENEVSHGHTARNSESPCVIVDSWCLVFKVDSLSLNTVFYSNSLRFANHPTRLACWLVLKIVPTKDLVTWWFFLGLNNCSRITTVLAEQMSTKTTCFCSENDWTVAMWTPWAVFWFITVHVKFSLYIYILICISYIYISIESRYMSRCFPFLYNENRGSLSPLDMSAKCCLDHPKHV